MDDNTKRSGYLNAEHVFGYSSIVRIGSNFYVRWQIHKRRDTDKYRVQKITREQYYKIKGFLIGVRSKQSNEAHRTIRYVHDTNSTVYMRVKRYLIKEELL